MLTALAAAVLLQTAWRVDYTAKYPCVTRVVAMDDRLVLLDSPQPTHANGGDIVVWRDRDAKPVKVFSVDEQGVRIIRRYGKTLIVPGIDATESWDLGNWYLSKDSGDTWIKYRNLPKAVHVFDMVQWRGRYYAGISDTAGAVISSPTGAEWKREFGEAAKGSFGEVLSLVPLPDALYAFWVEQWGSPKVEANRKTDCYRFDGKEWKPLKLLPGVRAVWNTKVLGSAALLLLPQRSFLLKGGRATPVPASNGITPTDVLEHRNSLLWLANADKQWAIYRTPFDREKMEFGERVKVIDLPAGVSGNSMAIRRDRLFVGCTGNPAGQLVSIPLSELDR